MLVDTPGLHRPRTLLGKRLNDLVRDTYSEVDVIGLCIPADEAIGPGDRWIRRADPGRRARTPRWSWSSPRSTRCPKPKWREQLAAVSELVGDAAADIVPVSATTGEQMDVLVDVLAAKLPPGPGVLPGR